MKKGLKAAMRSKGDVYLSSRSSATVESEGDRTVTLKSTVGCGVLELRRAAWLSFPTAFLVK